MRTIRRVTKATFLVCRNLLALLGLIVIIIPLAEWYSGHVPEMPRAQGLPKPTTHAPAVMTATHAIFDCSDPCVVEGRGGEGGSIELFRLAAFEVIRGMPRRVVINGPCASACALFADMVRGRVCITERAKFGFHKGMNVETGQRFDMPHSLDILQWIRNKGGFPVEGMLVMNFKDAKKFWPVCTA